MRKAAFVFDDALEVSARQAVARRGQPPMSTDPIAGGDRTAVARIAARASVDGRRVSSHSSIRTGAHQGRRRFPTSIAVIIRQMATGVALSKPSSIVKR